MLVDGLIIGACGVCIYLIYKNYRDRVLVLEDLFSELGHEVDHETLKIWATNMDKNQIDKYLCVNESRQETIDIIRIVFSNTFNNE